tara:strand:- start:1270 stop:1485 length:216 start_codon:yes stop_codon:yes gene_type:complete
MSWIKKIKSEEYIELKEKINSVQLDLKSLEMEFALMVKKLKIKYKITTRDRQEGEEKEESEDIKTKVLLPE